MAEGELNPGERFSWSELRRVAERRFGFKSFRPGQRELIALAMSGRDALLVDLDAAELVLERLQDELFNLLDLHLDSMSFGWERRSHRRRIDLALVMAMPRDRLDEIR